MNSTSKNRLVWNAQPTIFPSVPNPPKTLGTKIRHRSERPFPDADCKRKKSESGHAEGKCHVSSVNSKYI